MGSSDDEDCCDCGCGPVIERRLMLTLVTSMISFGYISWWLLAFIPWQWHTTLWGVINFILLHTFSSLLVVSYWRAIWTNAGDVPKTFTPPGATKEQLDSVSSNRPPKDQTFNIKNMDPERIRYCWECQAFKPPRSHHCRECNVCTLAMDHHCPWVGNCVGHRNYKYFLNFLLWCVVALSYAIITFLCRFVDGMQYYSLSMRVGAAMRTYIGTPFTTLEVVVLILNTFITLPVTIAIISLFVYQIGCVLSNQTSVEDYVLHKMTMAARRAGYKTLPAWPYDLGKMNNIKAKLGLNPWLWFIPIATPVGDGYTWKRNFQGPNPYSESPENIFEPDSRGTRVSSRRFTENTSGINNV